MGEDGLAADLRSDGSLPRKMLRYALAGVGPIGVAGAQFLMSVQLLHSLPPLAFGAFSFLLVASQFSTGIWTALFFAPMPILLSTADTDLRAARQRSLMAANLAGALAAGPVFAAVAFVFHAPWPAALAFGAFGAANLMRWFGRAYAYAAGAAWRTMASDVLFALALLAGVAIALLQPSVSLVTPYSALLAAAVLGLAPFGGAFLRRQFLEIAPRDLRGYGTIWLGHARWSLSGVLTTEATGNAHAYIVTLLRGANAFAPLAASALLMRPVSVASNALTDFERPQLARLLAAGRFQEADRAILFFRLMLLMAWVGTVGLAALLMRFAPQALFPPQYDRPQLALGAWLWLAVAFVRLLRTPESVLLQASGQFRALAHASLISCGVSVAAVTVLLVTAGPVWSIVGVLAGEIVFAVWTRRQKTQWMATQLALGSGHSLPPPAPR